MMTGAIDVLAQTGASIVQEFSEAEDDKQRAHWAQLLTHFISEVTRIELAALEIRTAELELERARLMLEREPPQPHPVERGSLCLCGAPLNGLDCSDPKRHDLAVARAREDERTIARRG